MEPFCNAIYLCINLCMCPCTHVSIIPEVQPQGTVE